MDAQQLAVMRLVKEILEWTLVYYESQDILHQEQAARSVNRRVDMLNKKERYFRFGYLPVRGNSYTH